MHEHLHKNSLQLISWTRVVFDVGLEQRLLGEELLTQGKVAFLILAGGQGSRLGEDVPKGTIGVTAVRQKSLFQLLFERVYYAGIRYAQKFPIILMTSAATHKDTVSFLQSHSWFGLDETQVHFFQQEDLPLRSLEGGAFLDEQGNLAVGPNGNGMALHEFYHSGLWSAFQKQGVEHLYVGFIDNPLADPFDPEFLGLHGASQADLSVKSIEVMEGETVGVLAEKDGKLSVLEYNEGDGRGFKYANIGIYCFSFPFIKFVSEQEKPPLHAALKKKGGREFWKLEHFLFDVFHYAQRPMVLVAPRAFCFSPLKNRLGDKSLDTVKRDLIALDRRVYEMVTGVEHPLDVIELSPAFYYLQDSKKCFRDEWAALEYIDLD